MQPFLRFEFSDLRLVLPWAITYIMSYGTIVFAIFFVAVRVRVYGLCIIIIIVILY